MGRSTKPRAGALNRGHPLAQRLVGSIPFTEGGGTRVHDDAIGNVGTAFGSPSWVGTPYGAGLQLVDASSQYVDFPFASSGPWRRSRGLTVAVLVRRDRSGVIDSLVSASWHSYYLRFNASDKLEVVDSNEAVVLAGNTSVTNDGKYHLVAFTVADGASVTTNSTVTVYVDGANDGSTTTTRDLSDFGSDPFNFCIGGDRNGGGGTPFTRTNATFAGVWIWTRELPAVQLRQLAVDPFAMYRPLPLLAVNAAAGGADATGTAAASNIPITGTSTTATAGTGATGTLTAQNVPITGTSTTGTAGTSATGTTSASNVPITGTSTTGTAGSGDTGTASASNVPITGTSTTGTAGSSATGTASASNVPITGVAVAASDGTAPPGSGTAAAREVAITGTSTTATTGQGATGTATAQNIPITGVAATASAGAAATTTAQNIPITGRIATGSTNVYNAFAGTMTITATDGTLAVATTGGTLTITAGEV